MTLQEYLTAVTAAIHDNNPIAWPGYQYFGPRHIWRYIARGIGHGLAAYPEQAVRSAIGTLYGQIVVKSEFGSQQGVTIDAKTFNTWLLEARSEL